MLTFFVQGLPQYEEGGGPFDDQVWLLRNCGLQMSESGQLPPGTRRKLIEVAIDQSKEGKDLPSPALLRQLGALGVAHVG